MRSLRGFLKLLFVNVVIIIIFFPVEVIVHEGTHTLLYAWEGIPITSFHVLDRESLQNNRFGYVTPLKESRYGSMVHEGIAHFSTSLFIIILLLFFLLIPFKTFTVNQLATMGLKRNLYRSSVSKI
jgi:hypothetical protein